MKIAFISYEFPPDTGFGGIGTYTAQMAAILSCKGFYVEVFSAQRTMEKSCELTVHGFLLHRIQAQNRREFSNAVTVIFDERNSLVSFDLIESPEYGAEGLHVKEAFPFIPMLIKLHTPNWLVKKYNYSYSKGSLNKKIKDGLGISGYKRESDAEYKFTKQADIVCSPSAALANIITKKWGIKKIDIVPNIFLPANEMLNILQGKRQRKIISFFGRLEVRKGIYSLVKAIPAVIQQHPDVLFRFVGNSGYAADGKTPMSDFILLELKDFYKNIELTGFIRQEDIYRYYAETDIVIIPSLWENFPYVCLEAMSAAKPLIVSENGGIGEMVKDINGAVIIDPLKPRQISDAILYLLSNPGEAIAMGERNRKKVKEYYSGKLVDDVAVYYSNIIRNRVAITGEKK